MEGIKQEMPPAGGYGPIDWAKKAKAKPGSFYALLAVGHVVFAWVGCRWYWLNVKKRQMNLIEREMIDSRIALSPLMYAESDRLHLLSLLIQEGQLSVLENECALYWSTIGTLPFGLKGIDWAERCFSAELIPTTHHYCLLKQMRANRDEEAELMKDVPDWKVGTLWGKPVYNNFRGKFNMPHNMELYAHAPPSKRHLEKLKH